MPLYEFCCSTCGMFDQWRSMAESSAPAYCPTCQQLGKRIFSPPAVQLSGSLRLKQEAREPRVEKRDAEPATPTFKSHNGGRPWMISH
ncbi:MAG: zinc ribbon domain-containing protein [Synechococcales cyanobacterium C42_A2020_086]|jgi:putative FmdB family regulatory protein|nr:zinc ribbon domain-containing protein [Synechococcales cyanobacterium M58_A2018_015]MBF2074510.1 zinc ribbon domain-containing protein [Synechococcales cyanobacterium C42_A2020_086]